MASEVNLDGMMAKRKRRGTELADKGGNTKENLTILTDNKAKDMRFTPMKRR